ncbi:DUF6090 family protein [uncultured Flavobacterium sp.]|uniref:DUF6090 family protein n=1 Tax=uncultured Flavobacterium sp. TaxID=165435 RepID=UPI0030EE4DF8|tara:strand:- start:7 stop:807 length:801 start_codon:yes stop_codon:yes gene_type:complete
MIKFFRKIRQKMLTENKFSKYLIYAIGEIVLVVIGILIALQINNWNQSNQNKKQEKQILTQLLEEYQSNLNQINSKIFIRNEILASSIKLLAYRNLESTLINIDSLDRNLSRTITRPTFDPELSVSNELTNSGKLYLITNAELRKKISAFPSSLSELKEEEIITVNLVEERFYLFLMEHYQIGRLNIEFLDDEKFRKMVTQITFNKEKSLKDLFEPSDPTQLLKHPDFEDYLSLIIVNTTYTNDQSIGVKYKIEKIIDLISKELKK